MSYILYDIKKGTRSEDTWETCEGALINAGPTDILLPSEGAERAIDWMRRHPEWAEERLAALDTE